MKKHFLRERFLPFIASLFLLIFLGCGGDGGNSGGGSNNNGGSSLNLAGSWNGNWVSSMFTKSGTLSTSLTQNGNSISGTVTITDSPCMSSATVSGSISGSNLTLQALSGSNSLNFSATATSTSISGTYSVNSGACAGDTGYISLAFDDDSSLVTPTVNVAGYWSGTYSSSLVSPSSITLELTQSGSNITGTDSSPNGAYGTVSGTVSADTIKFMLYQKTTGCSGTFNGTGTVSGDTLTLSVTGSDCLGIHASGSGTLTRLSPSPPTGLTATPGDDTITLNWNEVTGATSYNIYLSTSSGVSKTAYTYKSPTITNTQVHNFNGGSQGITYYYVVTAVNSYGESGESNEASAMPQTPGTTPSAPTGVLASAGDGQATISWSSVLGGSSYNIYYLTTSGVTKTTGTKITNATSPYTHTGLTNGTTYYYVVTAENSYGESSESSQVSAMPIQALASGWTISTIDTTGGRASIALDSNNNMHVAYPMEKYATNLSGSWVISTLDTWADPSIAVDSNDKVHISYCKGMGLMYATNISGIWVTSTIIDNSELSELYNSISIDSNNKVHISYYDMISQNLKYATNQSGAWVISIIDSTGDVGSYSSITVDSNDKVHIAYRDATNAALKYATNTSSTWVTTTIESVGTGYNDHYLSIAVDSNNKAHISYKDESNYTLKYATNISGSWVAVTIDSPGSGGTTGLYPVIAIDNNDKIHISYSSYIESGYGSLKYATNNSGAWTTSTIDDKLAYYNAIAADSNNKIYITYYVNGSLKYATNQ